MKHSSKRRVVAWNIVILLLGLLSLELYFGGWVRNNGISRLNMIRNDTLIYNISKLYPPHGHPIIRYTRDKYGLRGNFGKPDQIGILTVGGSTTDERYITNGETWQAHLQMCLAKNHKDIKVANAGVDGQSTYGHIKDFQMWFPYIPGLKPKYILYYIGINDFYKKAGNRFDQLRVGSGLIETIKTKSALAYLYRTLRGIYRAHFVAKLGHYKVDYNKVDWVTKGLVKGGYGKLMKNRLDSYESRVEELAELTRKMGAIPIFVTQETRYYKKVDHQVLGTSVVYTYDGVRYNGVDRYYMDQRLNQAMMAACKKEGAICIDLADELPFKDSDFYDYVHQTPAGVAKIGSYLCEKLKKDL